MNTLKITGFMLLTGFVQFCYAQSYQKLPKDAQVNGAQVYMLPKAAFQVDLYTVKKDFKKGSQWKNTYTDPELEILSKKYGVDAEVYKKLVAKGDYSVTEITEDSIKITLIPLADPAKVFYTYPKRKWNATQTTTFTYGNDGILTDAESIYENRTFDVAVKALSGLASIAGSFRGPAESFVAPGVTIKELDDVLARYAKLDNQNNFDVYKDLKATLEKQYAKIFAEYFYSVKAKTKPAKLLYCPSLTMSYGTPQSIALFGLDAKDDLYYDNGLSTALVWSKGFKGASGTFAKLYKIRFSLLGKEYQQTETYNDNSIPSNSYFGYNIPAKSLVSIVNPDGEELGLDVYKIPQFGKLGYVSAKKMHVVFSLDPVTGELKKLTTERKAITDDQVGNAATAITNIITTAKGDDADTKLDKEVKRLENEKKKRDLLKELEDQ